MALNFENSTAFFRDKFVPFKDANLSFASSPVLYGLSVYTVFNVIWDGESKKLKIYRLEDHYKRLVNSCSILEFTEFAKDWNYEKFQKTMLELLKQNEIKENVLVRVAVYVDELIAGTKSTGLKNSMSAYVYPMGQILPKTGASVCVSSWVRNSDNAIPSRAKVNGSYVNATLMKNEALKNGYDDAIALDHTGHVAEGTVANLFIVRGGVLITPDESTDILEGITRDSVMQMAKVLDIPLQTRSIDKTELHLASEMFFCGSSANITPIISVDKIEVGDGKSGEITKKISDYYDQIRLGKIDEFKDWVIEL